MPLTGAIAAAQGIKAYVGGDLKVRPLQGYFDAGGQEARGKASVA